MNTIETDIANFYAKKGGRKLVEVDLYPTKIKRYLTGESVLIKKLLKDSTYECVMEIGCMYGRLLKIVLQSGKSYRGIDLVSEFIDEGRKICAKHVKDDHLAQIWSCSVNNMSDLIKTNPLYFPIDMKNMLSVFPFNSFGNIGDPLKALVSVRTCGCDVLICTYTTDSNTNTIRHDYYSSCGYKSIKEVQNGKGVLFTSEEGLMSFAYHTHYLVSITRYSGYEIKEVYFIKPCGIAFLLTTNCGCSSFLEESK